MPDKQLICVDCDEPFFFTDGEQKFYLSQGFTDPKRCRNCRLKKKQKNESPTRE